MAAAAGTGAPSRYSRGIAPSAPSLSTGRIEGSITLSKSLTSRRPRFRMYAGDGMSALPPEHADVDERTNVVVYLAAQPDARGELAELTPPRAVMRQALERFSPHVLPVVRGTTVEFPNDDAVFHNVFSLSSAKTFDLGRFPRGHSKALVFDRSGVVQLFCHIHADMSAIILVLDSPLFAQADTAGRYIMDRVPPGDYTIVGWHERIRAISRTVHVEAGKTSVVDFDIPLPVSDVSAR
jgi:plastocyanin